MHAPSFMLDLKNHKTYVPTFTKTQTTSRFSNIFLLRYEYKPTSNRG